MALSQSVLSELLDAFRAGEGVDLIRSVRARKAAWRFGGRWIRGAE
jgi:hypothetical protein